MLKIACTVGSGSVYGRFSQKKNISRLGGKLAIEPKLSKKLERSEGSRNKILDIAKILEVRFNILIPRTVTMFSGKTSNWSQSSGFGSQIFPEFSLCTIPSLNVPIYRYP